MLEEREGKGRSEEGGRVPFLQSRFPLPPPFPICTALHCHAELRISFTQSTYTASEGDQFVALELVKSGLTTSDVLVGLEIENRTAQGTHVQCTCTTH